MRSLNPLKKSFAFLLSFFLVLGMQAQTNVFDDVISQSPDHTLLTAALNQTGLSAALQDANATLTVFAPDDNAINALVDDLGIDINTLLSLPNLDDILLYHVLGAQVLAGDIVNGTVADALSTTNTIKITKTSMDMVFVNQAQVIAADLITDNGVVHVLNKVILPNETVVDIALDNGFTSLATAVITAELLPALTDPFADFTVFAPTNDAFDATAAALGTDINGLLALPNLSDILLYHVLGASVLSTDITNGAVVDALSPTNTIKLTKTAAGEVFINQAQVTAADISSENGVVHVLDKVILPSETVVDIALDNGFTSLATAVITAELLPALTDPLANFTVFAPTNDAFDAAAAALGTDINGLLAAPNLSDIILYHALGAQVYAADITNGVIVDPISTTNNLKLTKTAAGDVFVNQAQVTATDIQSDNGVVHVLNEIVLPNITVVDVALDNGFTSLATAVITAELLPALTNPFSDFTVFAPTNDAFDAAATALGTDINGLLELPNLSDILLYHVLGSSVFSPDITNGTLADALNTANTIKLTKTADGNVFINQAQVTAADVQSDNGVVHVLDAVILPNETVVDVALDNGFSSLATAVITAELLPALSDPFANYTVFAPTNDAFDNLAEDLNTDLNGIYSLPTLSNILLYHVAGDRFLSGDLSNGAVTMLNNATVMIDLTEGVKVNTSHVTLADVEASNGVVHVIDQVLLETTTSTNDLLNVNLTIYPNPSTDFVQINGLDKPVETIRVIDMTGKSVIVRNIENELNPKIEVNTLESGQYFIQLESNEGVITETITVK